MNLLLAALRRFVQAHIWSPFARPPAPPVVPPPALDPVVVPRGDIVVLPAADIADYPRQVFLLANAFRQANGLPPFELDGRLFDAAQLWADHQASIRTMEHTDRGTPESAFAARLTAQGFAWSAAAENVAAGQPDPASVMRAWRDSPPHRANLLGRFARAGVGVQRGTDTLLYWVLDAATPL